MRAIVTYLFIYLFVTLSKAYAHYTRVRYLDKIYSGYEFKFWHPLHFFFYLSLFAFFLHPFQKYF